MLSPKAVRLRSTLSALLEERAALIASFPVQAATSSTGSLQVVVRRETLDKPTRDLTSIEGVSKGCATTSQSSAMADQILALAHDTVKRHIILLGRYNELRDIGQGLLGMIAEQRGVRMVDVLKEFGAGVND